jgi:hypothetical protein
MQSSRRQKAAKHLLEIKEKGRKKPPEEGSRQLSEARGTTTPCGQRAVLTASMSKYLQTSQAPVAYKYNPSSRDQEDGGSKPAQANSS